MYKYITPELLQGFHLREPEYEPEIDRKVGLLALGCIAVEDVDLTLTTNGTGEDLTSWGVLSRYLDPNLKKVDDDLYEYFEDRIRRGTITEEEAVFWWETTLGLFKVGGLTADHVREGSALMRPRPGVQELATAYKNEDIPTAWITAGVRDVCSNFAERYDVTPSLLVGTKLRYRGPDNLIKGWVGSSLVHPLNKDERSHGEITTLRQPDDFHGTFRYPGTLLLGDGAKDTRMVSGDKVLRVSVANPHGPTDQRFLESRRMAGYDLTIRDEGLWAVEAMVHRLGEIHREPGIQLRSTGTN